MDGKNVVVLNVLVYVSTGVENGIASNAVPLPTKPKSYVAMVKEEVVVWIVYRAVFTGVLERFAKIVDLRRNKASLKNAHTTKERVVVIYVHLKITAAMSVNYTHALIAMVGVYAVTPRSKPIAGNVRDLQLRRNESIKNVYTTYQGTTAKYAAGRIYAVTIDVNPFANCVWAIVYAYIAF